jgi:hypothetical protein
VPRPLTEPGKGAYWTLDFSDGVGNKRSRKRRPKADGESNSSGTSPSPEPASSQSQSQNQGAAAPRASTSAEKGKSKRRELPAPATPPQEEDMEMLGIDPALRAESRGEERRVQPARSARERGPRRKHAPYPPSPAPPSATLRTPSRAYARAVSEASSVHGSMMDVEEPAPAPAPEAAAPVQPPSSTPAARTPSPLADAGFDDAEWNNDLPFDRAALDQVLQSIPLDMGKEEKLKIVHAELARQYALHQASTAAAGSTAASSSAPSPTPAALLPPALRPPSADAAPSQQQQQQERETSPQPIDPRTNGAKFGQPFGVGAAFAAYGARPHAFAQNTAWAAPGPRFHNMMQEDSGRIAGVAVPPPRHREGVVYKTTPEGLVIAERVPPRKD